MVWQDYVKNLNDTFSGDILYS